ncbi:hypothetical protein [Hyphomonas johnsonii]|jgi:hypothetical protein|uniref:hypothetical protein n=1 Tax=Hyphomonas johnsonii TaxID=81031 RepID=UPI0012EBE2D0|nr:hypothetical protein [Hyphomonas johnsonii]
MRNILLPLCFSIVAPLAVAQGVPQAAPPTVRAPDMLVGTVSLGDLQLLLDDMAAQLNSSGANERGAPFVFATSESGMSFGIYTACADEEALDCRGVEFLAVFETDAPAETVNQLDSDYAAVSIYRSGPTTLNISRYVILDHGVTWANLLENAAVFEVLCERVGETLSEQAQKQLAEHAGPVPR